MTDEMKEIEEEYLMMTTLFNYIAKYQYNIQFTDEGNEIVIMTDDSDKQMIFKINAYQKMKEDGSGGES